LQEKPVPLVHLSVEQKLIVLPTKVLDERERNNMRNRWKHLWKVGKWEIESKIPSLKQTPSSPVNNPH